MSISNASLPVGATFAPTGGTATSLSVKAVGNPTRTFLEDGSALGSHTSLTFQTKESRANVKSPSGYTQARNFVDIVIPFTEASGERNDTKVRIELHRSRELTDAGVGTAKEYAMHILSDADFDVFWEDQGLS